jgi:hypothetical protein
MPARYAVLMEYGIETPQTPDPQTSVYLNISDYRQNAPMLAATNLDHLAPAGVLSYRD